MSSAVPCPPGPPTRARRPFLRGGPRGGRAALLGLLLAGCGDVGPVPPRGPAERVLLLTCDTLRADRLGAYAPERDTSPNLDAFAEECVVFDRAYAAAPLTIPALSSLMTGLLPEDMGMVSNSVLTPTDAVTIAEALSAAGVPTAGVVSNWVLRERTEGPPQGLQQGFAHYDSTMEVAERNRQHFKERLAPETTDAALAWLRERPGDRFFLWVHYQDPHGPYTPPDEYLREARGEVERELETGRSNRGNGSLPRYQVLGDLRSAAEYVRRYDGEVRYFDRELGRLLDALRAEGLLAGALVIFTSDHGESLGEHDWWFSHGWTLYDELVRVPFLVRYPAGFAPPVGERRGRFLRSDALVGHVDVFATVLDAFGLSPPPTQGMSLLAGRPPADRVLAHSVATKGKAGLWEGVTDGRWRLLRNETSTLLFDLAADPGELENLAEREPERLAELERRYEELRRAVAPLARPAEEEALGDDELEQMRALGYAGDDHED